jgi:hypothetical protein
MGGTLGGGSGYHTRQAGSPASCSDPRPLPDCHDTSWPPELLQAVSAVPKLAVVSLKL